jgi:hypothetical protein
MKVISAPSAVKGNASPFPHPCAVSFEGEGAPSPCCHPQSVSNGLSRSLRRLIIIGPCRRERKGETPTAQLLKDRPKRNSLSPDDIASRLFASLQFQIQRRHRVRPVVAIELPDIESQLRACRAWESSPWGLRTALRNLLASHRQAKDEYRILVACLEHLCQCLDLCWLESLSDADREKDGYAETLEKELMRVRWRHHIANTAVTSGLEENLALVLLSIMAGTYRSLTASLPWTNQGSDSTITFYYLERAKASDQAAAIGLFIALIRPKIEELRDLWYLDRITFVAWCYNLDHLDAPVATSRSPGTTNIRTLLGLGAFQRQDSPPSLEIQHCLNRHRWFCLPTRTRRKYAVSRGRVIVDQITTTQMIDNEPTQPHGHGSVCGSCSYKSKLGCRYVTRCSSIGTCPTSSRETILVDFG